MSEPFTTEIVGVTITEIILKKTNGTWKYKHYDLSNIIIDELFSRQKKKWNILGLAVFEREDRLLKLQNILL